MTLLDDIQTALVTAVDEYDEQPGHVTIEEDETGTLVATGSWTEMREAGLTDEDDTELPHSVRHDLCLTDDLEARVRTEFDRVYNGITASDSTIHDLTLCQATYDDGISGEFESDLSFICTVSGELEGTIPTEAATSVVRCLQNLDPEATADQLTDIDLIFSDRHPVQIVNVSGTVETPNPSQYYENVSSREEYIDKASELRDIDSTAATFEVFFKLRRAEEDLPDDLIDFAEESIKTVGANTIQSSVDYLLEAERLTYTPDGGDFTFFVHVPIEE